MNIDYYLPKPTEDELNLGHKTDYFERILDMDLDKKYKITQEEFIGRVITNQDFAKQLGVTIYTVVEDGNIRIGINYNDKTIESYE